MTSPAAKNHERPSPLTADRLRNILCYDPTSGEFTRLERNDRSPQWNGRYAGKPSGCIGCRGYRYIGIDSQLHLAHRLAWLYVTGAWPKEQIDHINGDRSDNRFANLREATNAENHQNTNRRKNNSSGYTGVSAARDCWIAKIWLNGHTIRLGAFDTPQQAADAYARAKAKFHTFQPIERPLIAAARQRLDAARRAA